MNYPEALSLRGRAIERKSSMDRVLNAVLMLLLVSCVFDPADRLIGMKVWLFVLAWGFTTVRVIISRDPIALPAGLLTYIGLFILIPALSFLNIDANGSIDFAGLSLFKGYTLISLALILVINRIDLLPRLVAVLNALAMTILVTFFLVRLFPELYTIIYVFGMQTGIVFLDERIYGDNVTFSQFFFVTSPMLVISIAYYMANGQQSTNFLARSFAAMMAALNVAAMCIAGTRNNILAALALPLALWFMSSRYKAVVGMAAVAAIIGLMVFFSDELRAFFDPNEISNNTKLALLEDYSRILSDPLTLMFGRGLGTYEMWQAKGGYYFITELTYLEMVRNFGLFGALLMFGLLLLPVYKAFSKRSFTGERPLAIGWISYLVMCISNPNLFSSMGTLILSVLVARLYVRRQSTSIQ